MKKKLFVIVLGMILLFTACTGENNSSNKEETLTAEAKEERVIAGEDFDPEGGADAYGNAGDNEESRYYKNPDFYAMKSDDQVTIIENFKTMQQTTEWACGNTTTLMVLNHLGLNEMTEMDLAQAMKSSVDLETPNAKPGSANNYGEYGTDVKRMVEGLQASPKIKIVETSYKPEPKAEELYTEADGVSQADIGNVKRTFESNSLYSNENKAETENWVEDAKDSYFVKWLKGHLEAGRPIMVEWADWDGHWQAIIGYDNNSTPEIGDDTLIFADPYDTSDHAQDGYYIYPLERWFYMWNDRNVALKPYQLQSYLVIDKAE